MFVEVTTKKGLYLLNTDKVLFASEYGKYIRIWIEDGTPIEVMESLEEICDKLDVKLSKEHEQIKLLG